MARSKDYRRRRRDRRFRRQVATALTPRRIVLAIAEAFKAGEIVTWTGHYVINPER